MVSHPVGARGIIQYISKKCKSLERESENYREKMAYLHDSFSDKAISRGLKNGLKPSFRIHVLEVRGRK